MLNAKDFINFKLTGVMATDPSDASGTNAFDLNTYRWSSRIETAPPCILPSKRTAGSICR